MNLDALNAFVIFSRTANFTRAAEQLHISQPALFVKIRNLADELGVRLYTKRGRELLLTDQGTELARFGREIQHHIAAFMEELTQGLAPPGKYNIFDSIAHGNWEAVGEIALEHLKTGETWRFDVERLTELIKHVDAMSECDELMDAIDGAVVKGRWHELARYAESKAATGCSSAPSTSAATSTSPSTARSAWSCRRSSRPTPTSRATSPSPAT